MRLLLTGATGFVGKNFLKSLSADDQVVCIGRSSPSMQGVEFVQADLANTEEVVEAANQLRGSFDAIVHLAAYVPKVSADDNLSAANDVNIIGLINILNAFEGRFDKLILGSTAEVYDQTRIEGVITEDSPVHAASYYGATKLGSEFIARTYGQKNNIPVLVLRFSVMYGADDPIARALPNFIKTALANKDIELRGAHSLRDYVHVDDVVLAIRCALNSENSGVVNIGTGKGVSILDAAQAIVSTCGATSKISVDKEYNGVDIVLSPQRAQDLIGFTATLAFPDKLEEMINSFRN